MVETEAEQWRIIRECHEGTGNSVVANAMSGHFGRDKTITRIKPLKGKFTEGVAEFMYELVCHHGAFKIHISDHGREFVNQVCVISHSYIVYMYIFIIVYDQDNFCVQLRIFVHFNLSLFFFFCYILRLLINSMNSQTLGTTLPVPIIPMQMMWWRDSIEQPKRSF